MFDDVLRFWFEELQPEMWWKKNTTLDQHISERFGDLHRRAVQSELFEWRQGAQSALAEVIVLDQFSRNIHRGTASAFSADSLALALSQEAIDKGYDQSLSKVERSFLYMPFMHSESRTIHERAVTLFTALGDEKNLSFELQHKAIIDRFGRYPHRNEILGRDSTAEESEFLKQPGSAF